MENKEDKYENKWEPKTICVHKSTQREEQRERERERSKGTSWREQGGLARRQTGDKEHTVPLKHSEQKATVEREVRRRGWKPMGHKESPVPKATRTKNTKQWREK